MIHPTPFSYLLWHLNCCNNHSCLFFTVVSWLQSLKWHDATKLWLFVNICFILSLPNHDPCQYSHNSLLICLSCLCVCARTCVCACSTSLVVSSRRMRFLKPRAFLKLVSAFPSPNLLHIDQRLLFVFSYPPAFLVYWPIAIWDLCLDKVRVYCFTPLFYNTPTNVTL